MVALAACGRIGFDGDRSYYLSPAGNDSNAGTREAPWRTFAMAVTRLQAGDQLTLLDADYDADGPSGPLVVDCMAGAASGTALAPIVVRADHPRRAHLTSTGSALDVTHCTGWEFDGLWLEGRDVDLGVQTPLAHVTLGTDITLRGLLLVHPNRYDNNHAVEIGHAQRVLVEDSEAYDFFRIGFLVYDSSAVTFRRLYANGRGAQDVPGGYASVCPGGDNGVRSYYATASVVEDSVVENTCAGGMAIEVGRAVSGDTGLGDHHVFAANIALDTGEVGFEVYSNCGATAPCSTPDRIASDNVFQSCAAFGAVTGFRLEGIANRLDHVTAMATENGVQLQVYDPSSSYAATAYATAVLSNGGQIGVVSTDQRDWGVASSNVFGATIGYMPDDAHVVDSASIDPELAGCMVYLPSGSPMLGAGPNATPIGADIRT